MKSTPYMNPARGSKIRCRANLVRMTSRAVLLADVGGGTTLTVTNNIEEVVEVMVESGDLGPGTRLFYFDSFGHITEALLDGTRFVGFSTPTMDEVEELTSGG